MCALDGHGGRLRSPADGHVSRDKKIQSFAVCSLVRPVVVQIGRGHVGLAKRSPPGREPDEDQRVSTAD